MSASIQGVILSLYDPIHILVSFLSDCPRICKCCLGDKVFRILAPNTVNRVLPIVPPETKFKDRVVILNRTDSIHSRVFCKAQNLRRRCVVPPLFILYIKYDNVSFVGQIKAIAALCTVIDCHGCVLYLCSK